MKIKNEHKQIMYNLYSNYITSYNSLPSIGELYKIFVDTTNIAVSKQNFRIVLKEIGVKLKNKNFFNEYSITLLKNIVEEENGEITIDIIQEKFNKKLGKNLTKARIYQLLNCGNIKYQRKTTKRLDDEIIIKIIKKVNEIKDQQTFKKRQEKLSTKKICYLVMSEYDKFKGKTMDSCYAMLKKEQHRISYSL